MNHNVLTQIDDFEPIDESILDNKNDDKSNDDLFDFDSLSNNNMDDVSNNTNQDKVNEFKNKFLTILSEKFWMSKRSSKKMIVNISINMLALFIAFFVLNYVYSEELYNKYKLIPDLKTENTNINEDIKLVELDLENLNNKLKTDTSISDNQELISEKLPLWDNYLTENQFKSLYAIWSKYWYTIENIKITNIPRNKSNLNNLENIFDYYSLNKEILDNFWYTKITIDFNAWEDEFRNIREELSNNTISFMPISWTISKKNSNTLTLYWYYTLIN